MKLTYAAYIVAFQQETICWSVIAEHQGWDGVLTLTAHWKEAQAKWYSDQAYGFSWMYQW